MKLQNITAERRTGCDDKGRPYDTWCIFLSFQDHAGKWEQFRLLIPFESGSLQKTAEAFEMAAQKLRDGPHAKPRP